MKDRRDKKLTTGATDLAVVLAGISLLTESWKCSLPAPDDATRFCKDSISLSFLGSSIENETING